MLGVTTAEVADVIRALASVLWVGFAVVVVVVLRRLIQSSGALSRLSVGATGVSLEFVTERLTAVSVASGKPAAEVDEIAQAAVFQRLQRSVGVLEGARVLWVDDHPESIVPVIDILTRYGVGVFVARSNGEALDWMTKTSFQAIVSDVGRDDEGPGSDLKGIELAEQVLHRFDQKVVLFTAMFNPATLPNHTADERLQVADVVHRAVQGVTTEIQEVLHLVIDSIERRPPAPTARGSP